VLAEAPSLGTEERLKLAKDLAATAKPGRIFVAPEAVIKPIRTGRWEKWQAIGLSVIETLCFIAGRI
jgi:hypothetical protein